MAADGRQPHVLIINDTQEILDLMTEILEEEGYRVTSSLEFLNLDKVKAIAPDVILQDLLFEGRQEKGWKFLHLSRLNREVGRIPLVLCTAAVQTVENPEMAAQLERLGVRVVLKPFDLKLLLGALREVLAARAARKQQPLRTSTVRDPETTSGDGSQDHVGMTYPPTARSVLVVDDDRQLCTFLDEILTEAGYEVRCVHDGEAAWLEIQTQPPDLILSDITMPRLDGISLARRLTETGSSIPIILMSSAVTVTAEVTGDVVSKPFALDALLARIASAIDERDAAAVGTPR